MKNQILNINCYPDKAQYLQGETVFIMLENMDTSNTEQVIITVSELDNMIYIKNYIELNLIKDKFILPIEAELSTGNYGVDVCIKQKESEAIVHTAFDIVNSATDSIRYGFLTDFSDREKQDYSDVDYAVKLHLNALQFYDWMYRHDQLVSDMEEYKEPLGRDISLQTVKNKIKACREHGIRPFAYGAVYAATKETYKKHPDWAFQLKNGEPFIFANWMIFMDTSADTPWCQHIIGEYTKSVAMLGFQGIHMDTYGFPKYAWNNKKKRVSLAETFTGMISKAKAAVNAVDDRAGVIFNAVNNWPVEKVAKSDQDAVYIEVWPPHVTYYHLYSLIREAKYLGGKNVILAAYIEAFKNAKTLEEVLAAETSYLLTNAVIQASGGTQIVLGETNGLLQDSYYVNYAVLRDEFIPLVIAYCDFTVRYGRLLFDNNAMDITMTAVNGINNDIKLSTINRNDIQFSSYGEPGKVWSIIKESDKYLTLQLINLYNINEFWNQPKFNRPVEIRDIQADILMDADVKVICYATPDDLSCVPTKLDYQTIQQDNGQHILFTIPKLDIWDLIWIELI